LAVADVKEINKGKTAIKRKFLNMIKSELDKVLRDNRRQM
jgi:hypothetical protein